MVPEDPASRSASVPSDQERDAELFRMLTEHFDVLISLRDPQGIPVYRSPSIDRVVGETPRDRMGVETWRLHPDDLPRAQRAWAEVLEGRMANNTFQYQRADSGRGWLESWAKLVRFRGSPHVLTVTRDVTERVERDRAHVWFLHSLDRVNRAIQGAKDVEHMMRDVVDVVIDIFGADIAGLVYPCDPNAPRWQISNCSTASRRCHGRLIRSD
jgi:PAS domain S-box-containing protein